MSKKATEFQRKAMSWMYRGKEIFKPLNTGWIDENVACVREWVANIFFYRKGDTTIMIDAGYNYDRLAEKMSWLGIDPKSIHHILITHQDTDHVGAVEADSPGLFRCSSQLSYPAALNRQYHTMFLQMCQAILMNYFKYYFKYFLWSIRFRICRFCCLCLFFAALLTTLPTAFFTTLFTGIF